MATSNQRKYVLFAAITIALCALAIYIQRHQKGQTGYIDQVLLSVTGGAQKQSKYFFKGITGIVDDYIFLVNTKQRNRELSSKLESLNKRITVLKEVEAENSRLRESLSLAKKTQLPMMAAEVIAHDVSPEYFGIRINKGKAHGIREGMGIVSFAGVVGRVHRVSENYSDVLTLIDPTSKIDSVVQRSRARGILSGQSRSHQCKLQYVDRLDDVVVDDTLVASGFGSIFPNGSLIGKVTAVIPNSRGILQSVTVEPAVDVFRLEEVFIVLSSDEQKEVS